MSVEVTCDVSLGSKADLTAPKSDFRFTPESGLKSDIRHFRLVPILLQKSKIEQP